MIKFEQARQNWWFVFTGGMRSRSALLGAIWADGFYLNAWPAAAMAVPLFSLLAGFVFGAFHPDFFALQPPMVVFAQSLPLLMLATVLGGLGAQFGLLAVFGYMLGEVFTLPPFYHPPMSYFGRAEAPRLVLDLAFLLLAVQPALATPALADSIAPLYRRFGKGVTAVRWLAAALVQGGLVWGWVHAAPMAMRLPWLWTGNWPIITFFDFWTYARLLPCVAAGTVLARGGLTTLARRRGIGREAAALFAILAAADAKKPVRRPHQALASHLLAALLTASLLLGLIVSWTRALTMMGIVIGLYLARLYLLPRLPLWNAAMRRTPLLVRWLGGIAVTFIVAKGWMVLPWSDVNRNADWGSFGAELSSIGMGLAVVLALFPLPADKPDH